MATIFFLFAGTSSSLSTRLMPCKSSFAFRRFSIPSAVSENTTVSLPSLINSISSPIVLSSSSPASTIIRSLPFILSIEFFTPLALRLTAPIFNTGRFIFVSAFTSFNTSIAFSSAFCAVIPSTTIEPGLLIRNSLSSLCFVAFAFVSLPCTGNFVSLSSLSVLSFSLSSITTVSEFSFSGLEIFFSTALFISLDSVFVAICILSTEGLISSSAVFFISFASSTTPSSFITSSLSSFSSTVMVLS